MATKGKTLLKAAIGRFIPGLLKIPEDLTRKLKNGKAEAARQKELAEFLAAQEQKIIEAVRWLSHDGYITVDTLNSEQFKRLVKTKAERELYLKVSNVQGGLYCAYCTVHRTNAEDLLAGTVSTNVQKIMSAYHIKVESWNERKTEFDRIMGMHKAEREKLMIKCAFYYVGKRGKKIADYDKMMDWLGQYPVLPEVESPKHHHEVRTVKIRLILETEKTVVKTKNAVTATGKPIKKKFNKTVKTRQVVREIIAPLPDDVKSREVAGVVDNTVARFPRGGAMPDWTTYEYEVV